MIDLVVKTKLNWHGFIKGVFETTCLFMKKIIASSLFLSLVFVAKSQNLSLGPVAGINHSWMTGAGDNKHFNPGVNLGATITYSFNPQWGIGGDLFYTMEGVKNRTEGNTVVNTRDANLNFIRIQPKLIHFFGELGDRVRPKLFVGGSVCFLAGGNTTTTVSTNNESADITTKVKSKDLYNKVDAGLLAGAGINWRIGKATWLNTDLVYNNGLLDLSKSNSSWQASRGVAFNLGITFPIGTVDPK